MSVLRELEALRQLATSTHWAPVEGLKVMRLCRVRVVDILLSTVEVLDKVGSLDNFLVQERLAEGVSEVTVASAALQLLHLRELFESEHLLIRQHAVALNSCHCVGVWHSLRLCESALP